MTHGTPLDSIPISPLVAPALPCQPTASQVSRRNAKAHPRRRIWLLTIGGMVVASLLAAFLWFELQTDALVAAETAYRRNKLEAALKFAEGHLRWRPFSRPAKLLAARCLSRLGRPDQAEEYYQKAGVLNLEDSHIRAYAYVINNRRESAIRAYREILERWPNDVLALSRMAAVLISERRWEETSAAAQRLCKIESSAVIGHTLAGVVYHNTGESEQAIVEFARVLELDPELKQMPLKPRSMFWTNYAHNLLLIGSAEEAERLLTRALQESDDSKAADLLGQSYYLRGLIDEAERSWRTALAWDDSRFGTWWRIGKLELQRGRAAQAIEPLRRAIELEPRAIGPLYSLALAYRGLGRSEESRRLMERIEHLRREPAAPARDAIAGSLIGDEERSP